MPRAASRDRSVVKISILSMSDVQEGSGASPACWRRASRFCVQRRTTIEVSAYPMRRNSVDPTRDCGSWQCQSRVDPRTRMGRRGSREAATVRASVGLERATRDAEEWTAALRAAHATVDRGARRASAPAQQTRAVPDRRLTVHAADRAEPDEPRFEASEAEEGCAYPSHTFCSHLSMRGAPARAIQELAGHADLTMTQRYMHLSPAALDAAIRLLDEPRGAGGLDVSARQI